MVSRGRKSANADTALTIIADAARAQVLLFGMVQEALASQLLFFAVILKGARVKATDF